MSIEARQIQKTLYSYAAILNFTPSPQGLRAKFGACSVQNAQLLALIPRQSKKCRQKHGGFWPKIRHFYVTNLWYRPLTSYECGKRG